MANNDYVSGFCITRHHETCHYTLSYYDNVWVCSCYCHNEQEEHQ